MGTICPWGQEEGDQKSGDQMGLGPNESQTTILFFFRSAIVTGCKPWTIFEKQGFKGKCGCIHPNTNGGNFPAFYPDLKDIGGIVASAKKECDQKCGETLQYDTTMILKSKYGRKYFSKSGNDDKFCHG